ncbi:MAG: hypothetical protein CVT49_09405 [candidate division Zixibacteria bacterium HGW-Zixibacteria-1]|nr:MAG: hypothetical protein CVT49_09405 [candidate division Zixibacteria bacterium HGW-Zixibacteria-1]
MKICAKTVFYLLIALPALFLCPSAHGQGSIFGTVTSSNLSVPDSGQILFIGYLDGTDDEIHLESCIGAGYDAGNWFDDFQNYLTESPGNPYNYHFFNIANLEAAGLSDLIPDNSFQQENIQLEIISWPPAPAGFAGEARTDSTVYLHWTASENTSYRVYRRTAPSGGSFFRIDDPAGSLLNSGVSDSFYIDSLVDNISNYDYVLIPVESGVIGAHSAILTLDSDPGLFICGDSDHSSALNLLDILYVINFLYKWGPEPDPFNSADVDGRPGLNMLDITYLIKYLYKQGPAPTCPE